MEGSSLSTSILERARQLCTEIASLPEGDQITVLNGMKVLLHAVSPMREEPIDCVVWVPHEEVESNDYNPNKVAPPEMRLLEHSIKEDGFTQPIVTWATDGHYEVVDGFHRYRIGTKTKAIRQRLRGYLPVTIINQSRTERVDRIAATIRHNRARGKHQVQAMSDIIIELARRNWSEQRIAKELGMDIDEVMRLKQISGLAEAFMDREFSQAWEIVEEA